MSGAEVLLEALVEGDEARVELLAAELDWEPRPGSPFSNGDEGESWMGRWCHGCTRDGDIDSGNGCPLILTALTGMTPAEWVPHTEDRYVCLAWSDDPADTPDVRSCDDAQLPLIPEPPRVAPRYLARAACQLAALSRMHTRRRVVRTVELPPFVDTGEATF